MSESHTIELTPNYERIFRDMSGEAKRQAEAKRMFDSLSYEIGPQMIQRNKALGLRSVQRWFAPLTIAAQSATSVLQIEQLRQLMADILADIDKTAFTIEHDLDEAAAADDGKGLL